MSAGAGTVRGAYRRSEIVGNSMDIFAPFAAKKIRWAERHPPTFR